MLLDRFYQRVVSKGKGPPISDQVVLLTITDASYDSFGKNYLDRAHLAKVNNVLAELGTEAVGFDIIFHRPSIEDADSAFAASIDNLGTAYLPIAFDLSSNNQHFNWRNSLPHERLREEYLIHPVERGGGTPFLRYPCLYADGFICGICNRLRPHQC